MVLFAQLMIALIFIFLDPILSVRLTELGMNPDNVGLGFVMLTFAYIFGCILIGGLSESLEARFIITGAFVLAAAGLFLASGYINDELYLTFIGLAVIGFSCAGVFLPAVPEATSAMSAQLID